MRVKIEICGITNLEDGKKACELGADAIGFIFAESPRKISVSKAQEIIKSLPPQVCKVGVFVNEKAEKVRRIAQQLKLDALQLHGDESPDYCDKLTNFKIIKTFRLKEAPNLNLMEKYKVWGYLLDTYERGRFGGTGKTFDWKWAIAVKKLGKSVILSGGLNPENVKEAVQIVRPYAVDVSSGVEKSPGKKDYEKIKKFISQIKCGHCEAKPKQSHRKK